MRSVPRRSRTNGVGLADGGEIQWLPTLVLAEVFRDAASERRDVAEVEVRSRLLGSPRVDPNEETTRVAGRLLAGVNDDADGDGRIGWNDAYVAAIVTVLDRPVLADNVEDFERLGVAAESY